MNRPGAGRASWATSVTLDFILCHDRVIDFILGLGLDQIPICKPYSPAIIHLLKYFFNRHGVCTYY